MERHSRVSTIAMIAFTLGCWTSVAWTQAPSSPVHTASSHHNAQVDPSSETPPGLGEDDHFGSTNVPMDSWIYPSLERLAALGYIPTQSVLIRPWTRSECRRQVEEAQQNLQDGSDGDSSDEGDRILSDLIKEFKDQPGSSSVVLESVYARYGAIAGPALTDGYHFGQTWWNDFGRPLRRLPPPSRLWRGRHRRGGIGGCLGCGLRVMHRAVLVRANSQLAAKLFAIDDDSGFGGGAWQDRLRIRVVGHARNLPNVAALDGSGSLLLGVAPAVLDLDEAVMGCDLPVKECLNVAVVANGVEALVTLYVAEE